MSILSNDRFSEVVDVILFKYNSIDSRLWALIKNSDSHRKIDSDTALIGREALKSILTKNFKSEINKFKSAEGSVVHKDATSVYFLWKMLEDMRAVRWIKLNLAKNANYSRVIEVDGIKTIKFSLKTLRGTFRTFDYFHRHDIPLVNSVLCNAEILGKEDHYKVLKLNEILMKLDHHLIKINTSEVAQAVAVIAETLEPYEQDNPEVLIITDYDSDI